MQSPVVYIVFNRPACVKKTFAEIKRRKPDKIFIVADGPRPGFPDDAVNCAEVRELVAEVDWPCEVFRNYADENLGLKQRVSSGLDWVFQHVDRAIILEDDCLPHPDFFSFCDELLEYYADDERVSVITGNNFQEGRKRGEASYYFSKYNHCWGWATWRRAWGHYKGGLPFWDDWSRSGEWRLRCPDRVERKYWSRIFDRVKAGKIDSWAYPWTASVWYAGGLTATPNYNLVSNIGFGSDSTHTTNSGSALAEIPTASLGEVKHSTVVEPDTDADAFVFDTVFDGKNLRSFLFYPRRVARFLYRRVFSWKI